MVKIKFCDNPISQLSFIGLNKFINQTYLPPELSVKYLKIYKKMKTFTKEGFYDGLELYKINDNILAIKATENFKENTFLFEIGGEIVSKDYLVKFRKELKGGKLFIPNKEKAKNKY